jgi:phenylacetate-coenzyme A ligase PaaK-like adenylate-forming protein
MPLLRYRIGDLVSRQDSEPSAAYVVHGRARDALLRADGARVTTWQVDQCFADLTGLMHYQLRQADSGECVLRLLPEGAGLAEAAEKPLRQRLGELLQIPGGIRTEVVDQLVPTPSGKFRVTHRQ